MTDAIATREAGYLMVPNPQACGCANRCCAVPCLGLCGCQCHSDQAPPEAESAASEAAL